MTSGCVQPQDCNADTAPQLPSEALSFDAAWLLLLPVNDPSTCKRLLHASLVMQIRGLLLCSHNYFGGRKISTLELPHTNAL